MMRLLSLRHIVRVVFTVVVCLALGLTLDSCGSSKKAAGNTAMRVEKSKDKRTGRPKAGPAASHALADALITEARSWIGTPYRYGGKTKDGADCSGFVMEVYRSVAGISIPRNSAKQKEYCADLDKKDLTVGDLVFFSSKRSGGNIAHVGMYIGDGRMIHASSSKGVVESSIETNYFVQHYKGSGRIPLIAELVPIERKPAPVDIPAPEPPQLAVNTKAAQQPQKNVSKKSSAPKNSTTTVPTPVKTVTLDELTLPGPQPEKDLAAVTVASAFADAASTRAPLTKRAELPATPVGESDSDTEKDIPVVEKPDVDKPAAESVEKPEINPRRAATPAIVVRNAFGAASLAEVSD